jgi:glycosyltransferase involved in cell wall biosynthesis
MRGERLRNLAAFRLLRRADAVIAVSEATAGDAMGLHVASRNRLRVIPEAADPVFRPREGATRRVREKWDIQGAYILYVGALDARKDPTSLLEAWATARKTRPELELVIAGDPGRQAPRAMNGAIQVGRVADEELADLYSAAACFVFPSRYEGFGLPCLEAMSCACPVAAFRNSSIPEVVGDAGMLVADGDAAALGEAAAAMIGQRERWSRAGLQRARKFSWERVAKETISVYEALLA